MNNNAEQQLPFSRYHALPYSGNWYPDTNFLVIDTRTIVDKFRDPLDLLFAWRAISRHERFHSLTKGLGVNLNIANLTLENIGMLLYGKRDISDPTVSEYIIAGELAADKLFLSSKPVQEAMCAYEHDVRANRREKLLEDGLYKKFLQEMSAHTFQPQTESSERERLLDRYYSFHEALKQVLLSDPDIRKCYNRLIEVESTCDSIDLVQSMCFFILDAPFPTDRLSVIQDISPSLNCMSRFAEVTETFLDMNRRRPISEWDFFRKYRSTIAESSDWKTRLRAMSALMSHFGYLTNLGSTKGTENMLSENYPVLDAIVYDPEVQTKNGSTIWDGTFPNFSENASPKFLISKILYQVIFLGRVHEDNTITLTSNPSVPRSISYLWALNWSNAFLKDCIVTGSDPEFFSTIKIVGGPRRKPFTKRQLQMTKRKLKRGISRLPSWLEEGFKESSRAVGRRVEWLN